MRGRELRRPHLARAEPAVSEPTAGARRDEARAGGIAAAAALLAGSVLLSRVLGFAREALLAYRVGASGQADAYYAAFQIPDLLNHLLAGGALSIAFLPLYTRVRTEQGEAAAERAPRDRARHAGRDRAAAPRSCCGCVAEPLVALQFPRFDAARRRRSPCTSRASCCRRRSSSWRAASCRCRCWRAGASSPRRSRRCSTTLGIIAGGAAARAAARRRGLLLGRARRRVGGTVAGAVARRAPARAGRGSASRRSTRRSAATSWVAAPLMFGQTLLTVDEWYGRWFGGLVGEGVIAQLSYARKLMLVPGRRRRTGDRRGGAADARAALHASGEARRAGSRRARLRCARRVALGVLARRAPSRSPVPLVRSCTGTARSPAADATAVARLLCDLLARACRPGWRSRSRRAPSTRAATPGGRCCSAPASRCSRSRSIWCSAAADGASGLAVAGVARDERERCATLLLARRLHGGPALGPLATRFARASGIAALAPRRLAAVAARLDAGLVGGGRRPRPRRSRVFGGVRAAGIATLGDESLRSARAVSCDACSAGPHLARRRWKRAERGAALPQLRERPSLRPGA